MVRGLGVTARMSYGMRHSKLARAVFALLMLAAVGASVFARPKQLESLSIKDVAIRDASSYTFEGQYVRVQGLYNPDASYQHYLRLESGFQQGFRGNYVVLADPSNGAVIWVRRAEAPLTAANEPLTLVGRIAYGVGDNQPAYYLVSEYPPNVRLANFLARAGLITIVVGAFAVAFLWGMHRVNYALPALFYQAGRMPEGPDLLWFGSLGRQFDDAVLQNEPGRFVAGIHEGRFESTRAPGIWSICIRRLRRVELFTVATPNGALPAARIAFEDERGMQRNGVIAATSSAQRDAVLHLLTLMRA